MRNQALFKTYNIWSVGVFNLSSSSLQSLLLLYLDKRYDIADENETFYTIKLVLTVINNSIVF